MDFKGLSIFVLLVTVAMVNSAVLDDYAEGLYRGTLFFVCTGAGYIFLLYHMHGTLFLVCLEYNNVYCTGPLGYNVLFVLLCCLKFFLSKTLEVLSGPLQGYTIIIIARILYLLVSL
jgi:hypothetical protein